MSLNHKNFALLVMLPLLVILTACSIPSNSSTTTTPIAFHTSTFGPLPSNTIEIRPSPSPMPTRPATPTVTITPRATSRIDLPSVWANATATAQAEVLIATFKSECNQVRNFELISADGKWLAISCGYNHDQSLEIIGKNGKHWMLPIEDYMPDWILDDGKFPGLGGLYPLEWSPDEEYLYFSSVIGFSGGGTCYFGVGSGGLFRFDVSTGKSAAVLPLYGTGYEFSFSPDHHYLAYVSGKVAIYDLETSRTVFVNTEHVTKGFLTWSPDSSRLAYATCKETDDGMQIAYSAINIYTLASRETTVLLMRENSDLEIEYSDDPQLLKILYYDFSIKKQGYVIYDWTLDRIISPTP